MLRSRLLYLEYLAFSFASGKAITMDVTHKETTDRSLSFGLNMDSANMANMDKFTWYALNDNVMGGVSTGNVTQDANGNLAFYGKLSKKNRGGFASCRTELTPGLLTDTSGLSLTIMGDGREYAILATPFQRDTGVNYQYKFTTTPGKWETLTVPYDQMFMSIRGFRPPIYPKLTGDEIHKVGLLIADKNDQDAFRLTVQIITAFNKQV